MNKTNKLRNYLIFPLIFVAVATIGLYLVKWSPYYAKAFIAAAKGSIGLSIISGGQTSLPDAGFAAALAYGKTYFDSVWKALILGLLLGSLVQVLIPRIWVVRFIGNNSLASIVKAALAALPGMMCTCCTAPVAVGLRKAGAAIGPAIAFFLGNPVLNPATLIFMGFVLGWDLTFFRIIMGLILVLGTAYGASKLFPDIVLAENQSPVTACPNTQLDQTDNTKQTNLLVAWLKALWQLILDTIPAYLVVVLVLGALRAWLFPILDPSLSDSLPLIIGLSLAGTLFVIPTAAEIPVVQGMILLGLGMGSSLALLMTLPAVSLVSLLLVRRVFPVKILLYIFVSVAIIGFMSGLIGMFAW